MIGSILTDVEAQRVRDNEPTFSDRPYGVDLPSKMQLLADEMDAVVVGQATVLNTATAVVVSLGEDFADKLAVVSFGEAPTAATWIFGAVDGNGDLTITIDQDNTADLLVNYMVDGR